MQVDQLRAEGLEGIVHTLAVAKHARRAPCLWLQQVARDLRSPNLFAQSRSTWFAKQVAQPARSIRL